MKKLITAMAVCLLTLSTLGQGSLIFMNTTNNLVTDQYGNGLTSGTVELYYNDFDVWRPFWSPIDTWQEAGVFSAGVEPINVILNGNIELKVRVYDTATPSNYAESQPFAYYFRAWDQRHLSTPLAGMQSFAVQMTTVPEPSAMAFAGLCTSGLLIFRKRNYV